MPRDTKAWDLTPGDPEQPEWFNKIMREHPKKTAKLIAEINTALEGLRVPKRYEGTAKGEYIKGGMILAIEAVESAIKKYKRNA